MLKTLCDEGFCSALSPACLCRYCGTCSLSLANEWVACPCIRRWFLDELGFECFYFLLNLPLFWRWHLGCLQRWSVGLCCFSRQLACLCHSSLHTIHLWLTNGLLIIMQGVECQLNLNMNVIEFLYVPFVACSSVKWKELLAGHVVSEHYAGFGFYMLERGPNRGHALAC